MNHGEASGSRGLNRAKRKASKGCTGIVIRHGMVLLKNYLSINDQVSTLFLHLFAYLFDLIGAFSVFEIARRCLQLGLGEGGFYQPGYRDGGSLHLKMMCFGKNWDCETGQYGEPQPIDGSIPPQIPPEISHLVGKAIKDSQSLVDAKGEDAIQ